MGAKRKLFIKTGMDRPGIPTITDRTHLGDIFLERYRDRISNGFDDLKKFELIDRLDGVGPHFGAIYSNIEPGIGRGMAVGFEGCCKFPCLLV